MDVEKQESAASAWNPARILVVEDDKALLKLVQCRLGRTGYHTEGILNGTDALKMIARDGFTLLLLDYGLPDMSGEQFVRTLNEQEYRIPFIVATRAGRRENSREDDEARGA